MHIYIWCRTLNKGMWWTTASTLIFKIKYYKNANIANFVYYEKTLVRTFVCDTKKYSCISDVVSFFAISLQCKKMALCKF